MLGLGPVLELIHSDVWGPLAVSNHAQFRYYVLFIDNYSRTTWFYLMKDRLEVFAKFMYFMNKVTTQHSAIVKSFWPNNALSVYIFHLQTYFDTKGVIHETSCAHTPQQNGVAERKHRHLLEVTQSLITHMSVPKHQRPEALLTACFLINRKLSVFLSYEVPCQLLFPHKPLFSIQPKTFGCVCFVHVLRLRKYKLFAKSLKCVFLGYARYQKGCICYNPSLKKTFVTMDVTLFDDEPFILHHHPALAMYHHHLLIQYQLS